MIKLLSYTRPMTVTFPQTYWNAGKLSQYPTFILFQKECIQVSETNMVMVTKWDIIFRDSAYKARIQLAVLDHNSHVDRNPKQHSHTQNYQYHRRYRKQSRNWDVVKVLEAKEYKYIQYIPELSNAILKFWQESTSTMRKRNPVPANHPSHIQPTIAHTQPPETHTIVSNKKSRFT